MIASDHFVNASLSLGLGRVEAVELADEDAAALLADEDAAALLADEDAPALLADEDAPALLADEDAPALLAALPPFPDISLRVCKIMHHSHTHTPTQNTKKFRKHARVVCTG